ncbi:golgin subfamily B member 1-like isoform X2 [Rhopilema esculentum]
MDPVRRLPRSSELIRMEKQKSQSRENMSSSTDSLNEGNQKKARLKIPKPSKLVGTKSRGDEKDKRRKEDTNNNNAPKKTGDSLERIRSRKSGMRRQSSKDSGLIGPDPTKSPVPSHKHDSKEHGRGTTTDSPAKERSGNFRARSQVRQVSFDEGQRRKSSPSSPSAIQTTVSEPVKMRPRRNTERVMRDYRLSLLDVKALKCLLEKVDLFDSEVRDAVTPLLKDAALPQEKTQGEPTEGDHLSEKVIIDSEKESLKEKLFLSRKELDSYISFCKKMEREKRQTISEKEDLNTKVQWLDKRLTLVESENKALKIERAELLNQIYKLRCPANVPGGERARTNTKTSKESDESQAEVEVSKQRLLYEADAFAQERSKMIKERQRLDEEIRKVQIRCVSLLAQLQHSEKTVDELQRENEEMKVKLESTTTRLLDDQRLLQEKIKDVQDIIGEEGEKGLDRRMSQLLTRVKQTEDEKYNLSQETSTLTRKIDDVTRDNRFLTEEKLNLECEVMSLRDSLKADQKAKNECEVKLAEVDTKLHHVQAELRLAKDNLKASEKQHDELASQLDETNAKMIDMKRREVELESEKVAFQKFIEMLSLEMEERLGEEIVSTDAEANSLQEKADLLGKQISAHLTPSRKIQENVQDLKEELEEIKQENKALKYAMSCRLEIQNMQVTQTCNCSSEKEMMKRELDEAASLINHLEDEVKRLHEDKQSLLMSFLNLQAASRSREPSRNGTDGSSQDEDSGDLSDTEDDETYEDEHDNGAGSESELTDEEDEISDDYQSDRKGENGQTRPSLRKALSLPSEALRRKVEPPAKPSTPEEIIANLESKLEEMKRTKEVLEDERVSLLDTLCKQDKQVSELKDEIEHLEDELDQCQPADTSASQGETCGNCIKSSNEIRQYLSIIQTLTEDKLSLEKSLSDIRRDKEQLLTDIETVTKERFEARSELSSLKTDADELSTKYQKEMESLLQNMESLEQENKTLEEHLQNMRQNKMDLLEDLKVAEQDRLGLVKSLQALTMDKGNSDPGDVAAKPIIVEDYIDSTTDPYSYAHYNPKRRTRRSFSTGDKHGNTQGDDPKQIIDEMQIEMVDLRRLLDHSRKENMELRKGLERVEALLQMEQKSNRQLEKENMLANEEILCLQNELETLQGAGKTSVRLADDMARKTPVILADDMTFDESEERNEDFGNPFVRHSSWSNLAIPTSEPVKKPRMRKISAPCGPSTPHLARSPSVSKAKTLCFQISFNGMTLMEKTDFGNI